MKRRSPSPLKSPVHRRLSLSISAAWTSIIGTGSSSLGDGTGSGFSVVIFERFPRFFGSFSTPRPQPDSVIGATTKTNKHKSRSERFIAELQQRLVHPPPSGG